MNMVDIEATIDLRACSARRYKNSRALRWGHGIVAIVLGINLAVISPILFGIADLERAFRVTYGAVFVIPAMFIAVCCWTFRMLGPGATQLVMNDTGVRFGFPGGHAYSMSWSDRRFRLKLIDYRRNPIAAKYGVTCYVKFPARPTSLLSEQAFAEIISRARSHGLDVHERTLGGGWRGDLRNEIVIRSPSS